MIEKLTQNDFGFWVLGQRGGGALGEFTHEGFRECVFVELRTRIRARRKASG
jgi:hypothetical protein